MNFKNKSLKVKAGIIGAIILPLVYIISLFITHDPDFILFIAPLFVFSIIFWIIQWISYLIGGWILAIITTTLFLSLIGFLLGMLIGMLLGFIISKFKSTNK